VLELLVVGHHERCDALVPVELQQQGEDDAAVHRVQVSCRLVQQQQLRPVGDGAGDGDALLLAA
jgi:hypothetical protein